MPRLDLPPPLATLSSAWWHSHSIWEEEICSSPELGKAFSKSQRALHVKYPFTLPQIADSKHFTKQQPIPTSWQHCPDGTEPRRCEDRQAQCWNGSLNWDRPPEQVLPSLPGAPTDSFCSHQSVVVLFKERSQFWCIFPKPPFSPGSPHPSATLGFPSPLISFPLSPGDLITLLNVAVFAAKTPWSLPSNPVGTFTVHSNTISGYSPLQKSHSCKLRTAESTQLLCASGSQNTKHSSTQSWVTHSLVHRSFG